MPKSSRQTPAQRFDRSFLQAMVEAAVDGIIAIDENGIVQMMNPAAERLFGYSSSEVLGKNVRMLMPEPYRKEHDNYLKSYLTTGKGKVIGLGREVAGLRKDGSVFPFHLSVAEVRDGDRRLFTGIVHDLTVRKKADEQTRFLATIMRDANDAITAQSLAGKVIAWNRGAERMYGWTEGEAIGMDIGSIIPDSKKEEAKAVTERLARGESVAPFETQRVTRDGRKLDVRLTAAPLADESGDIIGVATTEQDMSERKRTRQELQRMRSYLKNIVDSMPSVLVGVDSAGHVTEWNQQAERATGVPADEAMGRCFVELLPDLVSQVDTVGEAIEESHPVRTERLITEKDGEIRYSDVMVYPLVANGASGAVIRIDDITNRVRIEQMMVQTEKMMSVGGLAAGMAHEINNPLSAILQSSQNIERRLSPDLTVNQRTAAGLELDLAQVHKYLEQRGILEFLKGIQEASARATRIVVDMLGFSRRSDREFSPVRVDEMLDTVIRLAASDYDLKKNYDFRQVEIAREYAPDLPEVRCERTEIEQVFLNVIKNAAQAMAEAGTPPPQRIILRTGREDEMARIEIEDNGPGMDAKTRSRVFEPFYTTKPVGIGTGLGLSVSFFIVTDQHHGRMSVESAPGKGTRFVIRLPFAKRQTG